MKDVIEALFPPDIKPVARWRLIVFAALVVLGVHVLWSCGWFARWGFGGGFAYADEVKAVRAEVSSIKLELMEQRIFETRVRQCQSTQASRRFYTEKIQELLGKYFDLTKNQYRLPACEEL